ncbi:MAG TPA: VOC family protein [Candidatus Dormibacteraeota bacterium]|jgi:catechol 2,3-dioxygenase-like lactoylglutathione lyase family enzyme
MQISLEGLTLHVADIARARDFYLSIPGAELLTERADEFALIRIGRSRLGLLNRRVLRGGGPPFHMEICTTGSAVDELYERVRAAGIETDGPPRDRPWGERTFHATDPDGNTVEFDSTLED